MNYTDILRYDEIHFQKHVTPNVTTRGRQAALARVRGKKLTKERLFPENLCVESRLNDQESREPRYARLLCAGTGKYRMEQ